MELDFEVDKITESIEDARTGECLETLVVPVIEADLKGVAKKNVMKNSKSVLAELDDIGFIGIPDHTLTQDDRAFFAQKAMEARQRYRAAPNQSNTGSRREHVCCA